MIKCKCKYIFKNSVVLYYWLKLSLPSNTNDSIFYFSVCLYFYLTTSMPFLGLSLWKSVLICFKTSICLSLSLGRDYLLDWPIVWRECSGNLFDSHCFCNFSGTETPFFVLTKAHLGLCFAVLFDFSEETLLSWIWYVA